MQPTIDNLLNKFSRIYVVENSFKDESGKDVKYSRLHLEYIVKGEPLSIEIKVDKDIKKDLKLLSLADNLNNGAFAPQS